MKRGYQMLKKYLAFLLIFLNFSCFAEYHSQIGQDRYVNKAFFKNAKNGFFLDIGAHDGVSISNTYFFESELGWSGICLEPNPEVFEKLIANRSCTCICGCASIEHNTVNDFMRISGPLEMLSGLVNKYDLEHVSRIEAELKKFGGSYEIIKVNCYNLNQILKDAGINHINFLSIDTEGGEYDILENFDFSQCQVDVITVEDAYRIHDFNSLLKSKGFKLAKRLEWDVIFVHKNFLKK
jgi:FkbM family methyltransferase